MVGHGGARANLDRSYPPHGLVLRLMLGEKKTKKLHPGRGNTSSTKELSTNDSQLANKEPTGGLAKPPDPCYEPLFSECNFRLALLFILLFAFFARRKGLIPCED